jgi:hypothetical protein
MFGARLPGADEASKGVADSVIDFQKAVTEKLAQTMSLVPAREQADIAIEVLKRDRALFSREVWVRVHHRGGEPSTLYRFDQQGGFADIAEGTMRLIDSWAQQHYKAVVGLEPPEALRKMPPDIYFDIRELRLGAAPTRANAAVRLAQRRARARAAGPALIELLGDDEVVTSDPRDRSKRTRVGVVAALALAGIGMIDDVYRALASDARDDVRSNAAEALAKVLGVRTVAALQAAVGNDTSARVRQAAERSLKEISRIP